MSKLVVRPPQGADLAGTFTDLASVRTAPPMLMSAASVFLLTGSIVNAVVTVGVTSFVTAFWSRLVSSSPQ